VVVDPILLGAVAFVIGVVAGGLLNLCITRLPKADQPSVEGDPGDQWLVREAPLCSTCRARVPWHRTIAVLNGILHRGRCPSCGAHLAPPYLGLELAIGVVWAGCAVWFGLTPHALSTAVFCSLLVAIAVADYRSWIIPHEFTWTGILVGLAFAASHGASALLDAALGAVLGLVIFLTVAWPIARWKRMKIGDVMGGGDYWMIAMIGMFVGWLRVPLVIFLSALAGSIIFVPLALQAQLRHRDQPKVPFGVFLAIGAAASLVFGDAIIRWYREHALGA
jgi:leader peptidase (prepilin peptidase) / N-methyltransferase